MNSFGIAVMVAFTIVLSLVSMVALGLYIYRATEGRRLGKMSKAQKMKRRKKAQQKEQKKGQEKGQKKPPAAALPPKESVIHELVIRYEWLIAAAIMLVAAFIRLYLLGEVPGGIAPDEASIGYDSYAIANYGMDRNGHHNPVYPIGWGAGHGAFYMYLVAPFVKLFGLDILVYRLPNAILSIAGVYAFYLLVKRLFESGAVGLLGMFIMATAPFSIVAARWGLDANPLPPVFIIAVYLFVLAIDKQKTWIFVVSSITAALTTYIYGAGAVVAPMFLLMASAYLLVHKKLKWSQFIVCGGVYAVAVLPYVVVMLINMLRLPPILTPFVSFGRFTAARTESIFVPFESAPQYISDVAANILDYLNLIFLQRIDIIWNMVTGFGTVYLFATPLIILGFAAFIYDTIKTKGFNKRFIMLCWFVAASLFAFVLFLNMNRIGVIFPAVAFLVLYGILFLSKVFKPFAIAAVACIAIGFCIFGITYFTAYAEEVSPYFHESLDEAIAEAMKLTDGTIYVTQSGVNGPGVTALFVSQPDPKEYLDTVVYFDPDAEFRHEESFGRFVFYIPYDKEKGAVYIVHNYEIGDHGFSSAIFEVKHFKYFAVVY